MDKRFWICGIVVSVAALLLDFLVHGVLLQPDYAALVPSGIYRGPEDANAYLPWMLGAHLLIGFGLTWLYRKGMQAGRSVLGQGLRFGTGLGPGALQHGVVHVGGHEQVDLRVGDVAAAQQSDGLRAEGAAALAACCDELVGRHADVVLRVGVRHTIGQGFGVVRGDVRNAVGGARDGHAAVCACSAWLAGAARQKEGGAGRCQGGQGHGEAAMG